MTGKMAKFFVPTLRPVQPPPEEVFDPQVTRDLASWKSPPSRNGALNAYARMWKMGLQSLVPPDTFGTYQELQCSPPFVTEYIRQVSISFPRSACQLENSLDCFFFRFEDFRPGSCPEFLSTMANPKPDMESTDTPSMAPSVLVHRPDPATSMNPPGSSCLDEPSKKVCSPFSRAPCRVPRFWP